MKIAAGEWDMDNHYLMAVDLGTSFIKAGIYDIAGNCISVAENPIISDSSRAGVFLQKGEDILASVILSMRDAYAGAGGADISAIGFTGQMAGFIGVDREWNDLTSWSCSLDTRYAPYAVRQLHDLQKEFLEIGGTNAPLMAPKCEWFTTEYPEKAARAAKYMPISSYVIGKLGKLDIKDAAVADSYLTWTGLADIQNADWSPFLCEKAGINPGLLPRIVRAETVCGHLSEEAAAQIGMKSGVPLVAGAGDKIAGCTGADVLEKGEWIFEASSYGAVSCLTDSFKPDTEGRYYDAVPALKKGDYYLHKYIPGSGITLKWFMDTFSDGQTAGAGSFAALDAKAALLPAGSDGLMAIGLLGGSEMPFNRELKGNWTGFSWNHRKEHFYRALLESYAYELAETIGSIRKMYPAYRKQIRIRIIGGGASSCVWPQILADVTGCTFTRLNRKDVAMLGTMLISAKAIGLIDDISEHVGRMVTETDRFEPREEQFRQYQKYMEIYRKLKTDYQETCISLNKLNRAYV